MSRRPPTDTFTRFTSNTPHASQNPASSFTPSSPSSIRGPIPPGPDGETPAQKVERLRAMARAQRVNQQLSGTEKMLDRGRMIADRMHRFTTYSLLGLTGASAVFAVYGLFSLLGHTRRQKRAWIDREMNRLQEAQQAFLRGDADAEQLHLLEQERAGEEIAARARQEKEKKKSESMWARMKGMIGKGAAVGDMGSETQAEAEAREMRRGGREKILENAWLEGEVRPAAVAESGIEGVGIDSKGRPVPANKMERVVRKVEDERRTGEDEVIARTSITGGPLDVLAGNVASAVKPSQSNNGWLSWIRGGGSQG